MNKHLRIAQLVLPWIPLPPPTYAGTERVVHNLTEELVKRGHEVTLFSVGESKTSAKLEYILEKPMGLQEHVSITIKTSLYPLLHVAKCFEMQEQFDIIHSHAQFLPLPFAAVSMTPSIHTFHRTFELPNKDEFAFLQHFRNLNFTSISNSQRTFDLNFIANVYNGVDLDLYKPSKDVKRSFLFWAGRVIENKGPKEAIQVAKRLDVPLIMAGKITELDYYNNYIKKEIDNDLIKFVEDLNEEEVIYYYQHALVTLIPAKWNEPFGLTPVESMACGTPVVAYANGGIKETIKDEITGYLVTESQGVEELISKTKKVIDMPKDSYEQLCRNAHKHVVENFSVKKMVDEYEKVYQQVLSNYKK